jgi:hypothetical protein
VHYISYRAAKALADQRAREAEIRAAREELLRQAGLEPHGRLYGTACRGLCLLGHGFVALGRRLERFDMNRPLSLEGSVTTGR